MRTSPRRATLHRVVEAISRRQREFLAHGVRYLRPMTLKDIAAELGVHESTVSRAVANKYVQTPQGTYELKFLFTSALGSTSGPGEVSSASVKSGLGPKATDLGTGHRFGRRAVPHIYQ